jgi:hypothetical protein
MKRLVVGVFVSAVAVVGVAPVASAAPRETHTAVAKLKKPKAPKVIDWDAPAPVAGGGFSAKRIDWD